MFYFAGMVLLMPGNLLNIWKRRVVKLQIYLVLWFQPCEAETLNRSATCSDRLRKGPVLFRVPGLRDFFVQHWGQLEGADAARFSVK
jgi:hypothetical protein